MASRSNTSTTLFCLLGLFYLLYASGFSEAQTQRGSVVAYRRVLESTEKQELHPLPKKKPKIHSTEEEEQYPSLLTQPKKKMQWTEKKEEKTLRPPPKKKTSNTTATITAIKTESKNQTNLLKLTKPKSTDSSLIPTPSKTLNSTVKPTKPSNSTKLLKPVNPVKLNSTKTPITNSTKLSPKVKKPTNTTNTKQQQQQLQSPVKKKQQNLKSIPKPVRIMPWLTETDGESDLISEFRDLPSKLHQTLLPDLQKVSTKSKAYLTLANKEFTRTFKPIVGNKYASTIATVTSLAFLLLPLTLIAILFHHLRRHYLSLQKILLSIHIYLAIYFSVLSLISLLTGLEPLRFFHATSPESYIYTQVLQTLGYVLYLLLLLMNLVVVFANAGDGMGLSRMLGLAQVIVGVAVGLHYYAAVFHRAVLGEPPKTNWKIHAVYASCFIVICAFARAERRKKMYFQNGADDGKYS